MRGRWLFDIERDYLSARRLDPQEAERDAQALYDADPQALSERANKAAYRRDLREMLGAGAVLRRAGALSDDLRPIYSSALRSEGRFGEAADLIGEVLAAHPDRDHLHHVHAELLAADGQFVAARAAAQRAVEAGQKDARAANIGRRAKWIAGFLKTPPGDLTWDQCRLMVEGSLLLRAERSAVEIMTRFMASPPAGEPSQADAIGLARVAHKIGLQALVRPMVARLHDALPDDEGVQALHIQSLAMAGEADAAADLADGLPPLATDAALPEDAAAVRRALRYIGAEAQAAAGRLEPAIQTLGALVTADRKDYLPLTALQRVMGDYVLGRLELPWAAPRPPKIINIFPFYNERTLLEMRIREMGDWVDHFVVVEATTTFTGQPKPLNFAAIRGAYADRGDQLLHVPVSDVPECMDTAWARDFYQRDMGVAALAGLWRPDDIILISDADEIVDRRALPHWPYLASLRMATSKFFLNYCADGTSNHANRRSGAICRAETLARFGITYVRTALSAARKDWETVPSAGWHFTSIGDADGVTQKFNAYAHQEAGKVDLRDQSAVSDHLAAIRGGEYESGWSRQPVDKRFPRYVRDNQALLAPIILGAPTS